MAKYLLTGSTGTTTGFKPVTITRVVDNNIVPYLVPPLLIVDEQAVAYPSASMSVVLVITKDGKVVWTSSDLSLYQPTLPAKLQDVVQIMGDARSQVQFQLNVLVAPASSQNINIIIETKD